MDNNNINLLIGYFWDDSIRKLKDIFDQINNLNNTADSIRLKESFLSIIENEKIHNNNPKSVSPDGMNYIYCIFDKGQYILINPYGVIPLFQNWIIYDGELDIQDVQWIENDHLVLFDIYYIVHDKIQKCICHFSNDDKAFVCFGEIQNAEY